MIPSSDETSCLALNCVFALVVIIRCILISFIIYFLELQCWIRGDSIVYVFLPHTKPYLSHHTKNEFVVLHVNLYIVYIIMIKKKKQR